LGSSLVAQEVPKKQTKKQVRKQEKQKKATEMTRQEEEGVLVYSSQSVWGIQLRTNGYGAFYERGIKKTQNPYVYGKINNFYSVQLSFGGHRFLGQKGNKNGVAVSVVYKGGLSLGLLRPYYIQVEDNGTNKTIKYSPETDSLFKFGFIIGSGGLGMGWGEMKLKPGAFAKTGLRFDFGRYNEVVSGIEVGVSAEYYSGNIPIMLYQKDKQFFYQGHIAMIFGRRK
jgi:hypothetical protein